MLSFERSGLPDIVRELKYFLKCHQIDHENGQRCISLGARKLLAIKSSFKAVTKETEIMSHYLQLITCAQLRKGHMLTFNE